MSDLALQTHDLVHVELWMNLDKDERRRRALKAANEKHIDNLMSLVEAYVTVFFGTVSEHTKASYRQGIALFCEQDFNVVRLSPEEAALYLRRLEQDYARASVSRHRSSASVLYDALLWADAYRDENKDRPLANPFIKIRLRKDNTAPEDKFGTYTDKDIKLLLLHCTYETQLILFLGAHGGLRASEMIGLEWTDVDLRNEILTVQNGKGNKKRFVPLTATLQRVLQEGKERSNKPLPYSDRFKLSYAFEVCCNQGGVLFQGKALHGLRHYAGTKAYQATTDLLRVGKFLGHAGMDSTLRYAKTLLAGFDDSYVGEFRRILQPRKEHSQAPQEENASKV
jgi:integrase/recombinase XerC